MLNQGFPTRLVFSCNRECFQSLVPDHLEYASFFVTSLPTISSFKTTLKPTIYNWFMLPIVVSQRF